MISIFDRKDHGYRDLRNPLRGLSMGRLVSLLDAGERGDYADLQWLYHYMERSDVMIFSVIQRRVAALMAAEWDIGRNRETSDHRPQTADHGPGTQGDNAGDGVVSNATGDEVRLKWVLGEPEAGHCPSCAALAGQVHTQAEWDEAGVSPGNGVYCGSDCHCSLVETDEPSSGSLDDVPVSAGGDVENAAGGRAGVMANTSTDAARDAAAAVRQAKAEARRKRKAESEAEADRDDDPPADDEAGADAAGGETVESAADAVEKDKSVRRGGGDVDRDGAEDLSVEAREAIRAAVRKRMMAAGR